MSARGRVHVVVTAGPTREHVDTVRFLSNESSGRMGFALARAAVSLGCRVTLIAGPVTLETPRGVKRIDVESALEMLAAVREAFADADGLYMAAAVADWRPAKRLKGKWRAKDGGAQRTTLELVRNPDILATVARTKHAGGRRRVVVGFALETSAGVARARKKLVEKNADFIVLNDPSALNAERSTVQVIDRSGVAFELVDRPKDEIAWELLSLLETPDD